MSEIDISELAQNISAVERETGLSKDVLRMWERRYGFPKPARDENGERQYTLAETAKLRSIKRLMDVGVRPGKLIGLTLAELDSMTDARAPVRPDAPFPSLERDVVAMLKTHDAATLQHAFTQWLMRQGLQRFVIETVAPLNRAVGDAWMRGELFIFEEHLCTELLKAALRTAINAFPRQMGSPRVLLTTLPNEQHGLGLLMVEALLVPEGALCVSLGPQTPLTMLSSVVFSLAAPFAVAILGPYQLSALLDQMSFGIREPVKNRGSLGALRKMCVVPLDRKDPPLLLDEVGYQFRATSETDRSCPHRRARLHRAR